MSYLYYNSLNEEKENFTHITVYIYIALLSGNYHAISKKHCSFKIHTLIHSNSIIKNQPVFVISVYKRKFKFLSLKSKKKPL